MNDGIADQRANKLMEYNDTAKYVRIAQDPAAYAADLDQMTDKKHRLQIKAKCSTGAEKAQLDQELRELETAFRTKWYMR